MHESSGRQPVEHPTDLGGRTQGLEVALRCARIADEYRGEDITVLDLRGLTAIFDYFVIVTGGSRRQMHAIAEEADRALKELDSPRRGREGYAESEWILQDYGDVVLHVFTPATRAAYDLESLWADAPRVDWQAASSGDSE